MALSSASEFGGGGWAIIEPRTPNEELVHFGAVDPSTDELTDLERPDSQEHPVGAEVQIAHPQEFITLAEGAQDPAGSTISASMGESEQLETLAVASTTDFDPNGGWALLSPGTEKAEPIFYSGIDPENNSLTDVTRLEPTAQGSSTIIVTSAALDTCGDMQDCDPDPTPAPALTPPVGIPGPYPVATLPQTPTGEVLVVGANIKQVYSNDLARRDHFAERLRTLGMKTLKKDLDGMSYAPDVILLQEVKCSQADDIASRLNGRIKMSGIEPGRYATAICKATPSYESEETPAVKIVNETAIIINTQTMKTINPGWTYVTTRYNSAQKCTSPAFVDSDGDGASDCGKIQYKRHFMMALQEKETGGKKVAVASVHLQTGNHLQNPSTHNSRTSAWVEQIDNKLRAEYPNFAAYTMTGDFNNRRCEEAPQAGDGTKESVSCTQRAWWTTLISSSRGYKDGVFHTRAGGASQLEPWLPSSDQRDLDVLFYDGYKNTPINPNQIDPAERFRKGKRIDFAFSRGLTPRASGWDITCGINPGSSGIPPHCDALQNPDKYSDHRLLWTLLR